MEIPKSLQSAWNEVKKDGNVNQSDFNKLVKAASPEKLSKDFNKEEVSFLANIKNELDKSNQNIKTDKLDINSFKVSSITQPKIKIPDDIKVPEQLKDILNDSIKDGVLTKDDYQKIVKSSMGLKNNTFSESYEFIKTLGDKLQENKGVVFFVDNEDEISLNELNELLDISDMQGSKSEYSHNFDIHVADKFKGAYYRKVESEFSTDNKGINGVGVLPSIEFDSKRFYTDPKKSDSYKTGPLDRPSVYFGGRANNKELDVGLTWDRVYNSDGLPSYTDKKEGTDGREAAHRFVKTAKDGVSVVMDDNKKIVAKGKDEVNKFMKNLKPNFAFRPFWRTTNDGGNQWNQPPVGHPGNMYFYPDEKIDMNVKEKGSNKVKIDISLVNGKINQHFEKTFEQEGFGVGNKQSFKRVNSIDQFTVNSKNQRVGLEGKDVLPSNTKAKGGGWYESSIIDSHGNKKPISGTEFKEVRGGDTAKNYDKIFKRYNTNPQGGEMIDITPLKAR